MSLVLLKISSCSKTVFLWPVSNKVEGKRCIKCRLMHTNDHFWLTQIAKFCCNIRTSLWPWRGRNVVCPHRLQWMPRLPVFAHCHMLLRRAHQGARWLLHQILETNIPKLFSLWARSTVEWKIFLTMNILCMVKEGVFFLLIFLSVDRNSCINDHRAVTLRRPHSFNFSVILIFKFISES